MAGAEPHAWGTGRMDDIAHAVAIFEFGRAVDGAEGKLGPAVIADLG